MAQKSIVRRLADSWQNVLTGLGVEGKDHTTATTFAGRFERSASEVEALYEQDAIFAKVIDAYPEDGTRRWIKVTGEGEGSDDFGKAVIDALDILEARDKFAEWWVAQRLYGGALMIFGADDGQPIDQPLKIEAIKSVSSLSVINRWDVGGTNVDQNPLSKTYGEIQSYTLSTGVRIHASRTALLNGSVASKRRLIERGGWGSGVIERLWEPLRAYGSAYAYTEAMLKDAVQGVLRIQGANEILLADDGGQAMLVRLRALAIGASAFNAIVIDKDSEDYERRTLSFAGIEQPILRAMDRLAGAAGMPLSKLFGQAPTGLSTDDESGRTSYYDNVANQQRRYLRAPIERLIEMLIASGQVPRSEDWTLTFCPLEEPSEKEEAETFNKQAMTDDVLIGATVISPTEARSRLRADPECPYVLEADEAPEPDPSPTPEDLALLRQPLPPAPSPGE